MVEKAASHNHAVPEIDLGDGEQIGWTESDEEDTLKRTKKKKLSRPNNSLKRHAFCTTWGLASWRRAALQSS